MSMFKRINANREERAGLTSKEAPKEPPKETPKDKPKRTMSQAEFSGYAKGGELPDQSPEDVAEAKRRARAAKAYDKAMVNTPAAPKKYAKGGVVGGRGDGCAVKGKTKGRMV